MFLVFFNGQNVIVSCFNGLVSICRQKALTVLQKLVIFLFFETRQVKYSTGEKSCKARFLAEDFEGLAFLQYEETLHLNFFSEWLFFSYFTAFSITQRWCTISTYQFCNWEDHFFWVPFRFCPNRNFCLLQNPSCHKKATTLKVFWFCWCNVFPKFSILEQACVNLNSLWLHISFTVITLKLFYTNCHSVWTIKL